MPGQIDHGHHRITRFCSRIILRFPSLCFSFPFPGAVHQLGYFPLPVRSRASCRLATSLLQSCTRHRHQRIGFIVLWSAVSFKMMILSNWRRFFYHWARGNTHHRSIGLDILNHNSIGANTGEIPNINRSQQLRPRTDDDVIANLRMANSFVYFSEVPPRVTS